MGEKPSGFFPHLERSGSQPLKERPKIEKSPTDFSDFLGLLKKSTIGRFFQQAGLFGKKFHLFKFSAGNKLVCTVKKAFMLLFLPYLPFLLANYVYISEFLQYSNRKTIGIIHVTMEEQNEIAIQRTRFNDLNAYRRGGIRAAQQLYRLCAGL
ncbi:MAG: hypothetical protein HDT48_04465 [Ruminococcaceae bacterium]|nr:hypothetical protein [Oscillospiraceae bacterium]